MKLIYLLALEGMDLQKTSVGGGFDRTWEELHMADQALGWVFGGWRCHSLR